MVGVPAFVPRDLLCSIKGKEAEAVPRLLRLLKIAQAYDGDRVVKEVRACFHSLGSIIIDILVIKV